MRIEIDTKKDSLKAIREIVRFLTAYSGDETVSQPPPTPATGTVSSMPSPPVTEPVPVPPPPAAAADALPETAPNMPVEDLDVNGKTWDSRIHASTKTKTKDGAWKYMRGLAEDVRKTVEAETDGATPTPSAPTPSTPSAPAPPATASTASGSVTPSQIIARVSELRALGKMDDSQLTKICAECGIESVAFIMGQNEQICVKFNDLLDDGVL